MQEQETHSSEADFRSRNLAEEEFKSKLQQTEGIISSLKKQLEANEEVLKNNNEAQKQLHATVDGLIQTLEKLNLTEEEQFGQRHM
jgi:glutaredoxin 2